MGCRDHQVYYSLYVPYAKAIRRAIFKGIHDIEKEIKEMVREKIYLTPEQKSRLEGIKDDIDWLAEEIRRAEYVGLDVSDLKARFEKMKSIRVRMLEEYGR